MRRVTLRKGPLVLLLASTAAGATSADVELVRPAAGFGSLPGMAAPGAFERGVVQVTLAGAYAVAPLVAVQGPEEQFSIIRDRGTAWLGVTAALGRTVALEVMAGAVVQRGPITPNTTDHASLGVVDPSIGLSWSPSGAFGARVVAWAPVGTKDVWVGERAPRAAVEILGAATLGRVEILGRAAVTVRPTILGDWNFVLGPSLAVDPGVRVRVTDSVFAVAWLATHLDQSDDGPLIAAEPMVGAQIRREAVRFDIAVGRGLTGGYGTSDVRVLTALHVRRARPPVAEPVPTLRVTGLDDPAPEPAPAPTPVKPAVTEVLRVLGDQVRFEQGSATLTREGRVAVGALASLLQANPTLGPIVVEGHASAEGTDAFNWDLSQRRARTVFEALLDDGVAYQRVSYRGLGERFPASEGDDPSALAESRRVLFLVTETVITQETP